MKKIYFLILLNLLIIVSYSQIIDTINIKNDTTVFNTPNPFLVSKKNYESINNTYLSGGSYSFIRSQDNPMISIDGVPINPILIDNTHYSEFLGSSHLLSYDISSIDIETLTHKQKITSGNYNNSIGLQTKPIKLGNTRATYEINNFTSIEFQDIDTIGYSTITNISGQKSYDKFGYRFSLSNGFHNDYIPENGLQRYSGNVKLVYEPIKQIQLIGFMDYSDFKDFQRNGNNNLKSNRIFSYLNVNANILKWVSIHGQIAINNSADNFFREITQSQESWNGTLDESIYFTEVNYSYNTTYSDFGVRIDKSIGEYLNLKFNFGHSISNAEFLSTTKEFFSYNNTSGNGFERNYNAMNPTTKERILYGSISLNSKIISLNYLTNQTNYEFAKLYYNQKGENRKFYNHLIATNFHLIKNDYKLINNLRVDFRYGRLMNYSLKIQPYLFFQPPEYERPDIIIDNINDNFDISVFGSFLKNRINGNFSYYIKKHSNYPYQHVSKSVFGSSEGFVINLGKLNRKGYEFESNIFLIENEVINWKLSCSYSKNTLDLESNPEFTLTDTSLNNTYKNLSNIIQYKNLRIYFSVESKSGYDINLYNDNVLVAEPKSYEKQKQTIGINNNGVPKEQLFEYYSHNRYNYITDADYFILKNIGIEYIFKDALGQKSDISIGLHYNKIRRIYMYVNDTRTYSSQFQKPSFYNTLSFSFKMTF